VSGERTGVDSHSILILDDRAADRDLLAILLGHAGYSVQEAATGQVALEIARAEDPDLVITDILMPGMNGYEFVRRLRTDPETDAIPVIFCTANYVEGEVKKLAAACGVSRFIAKPLDLETILEIVGDALSAPRGPSPPLASEEFDREQLRLVNDKLFEKVEELESANVERRKLMGRLLNAHEEERKRIADDLHDDAVQGVVALRMRLETLAAGTADLRLASELCRLGEHAADATERLRRLLFRIQPVELEQRGVVAALRMGLGQSSTEDGLEFAFKERTMRPPALPVRALLYRVGREALANVRNHARASRVEVSLEDDGNGFSLEVHDNGQGFDAEQGLRVRPGHLGLATMRERVEIAGGRLSVESQPGIGTDLRVWVPDVDHTDSKGPL
jgi:two-component system, sensor histidine kinase and response regulator